MKKANQRDFYFLRINLNWLGKLAVLREIARRWGSEKGYQLEENAGISRDNGQDHGKRSKRERNEERGIQMEVDGRTEDKPQAIRSTLLCCGNCS